MKFRATLVFAAGLVSSFAFATELQLEIGSRRSGAEISALMDAKVRDFNRNAADVTRAQRERLQRIGRWNDSSPFSLPTTLVLKRNGSPIGRSQLLRGGGSGTLTLSFDSTGPRSFPPAYRQLLQDTFAEATSTMNAVFGEPAFNATIHVRNYDADIQDRYAVAGGYFVPDNGVGEQEIRFPIYNNLEAASVNFVHCLLLAYMGPSSYGFDAFKEGLVRAATMRVARTAGALPASLDPELIESVLENTYDVGTFYDWYNQRGLGGPMFIAPNLRDTQLPPGGSLGGIYLLRYQMSGSAWQKALTEYPGFAAGLNAALYAQPSLASDIPGLIGAAQNVINTLGGSGSATLEGLSFFEWFQRQRILETRNVQGLKLVCHPTPLPPIGGTNDFGVFDVAATYFETLSNGDEILLSGVSYPVFWSLAFDRITPSAQEERMDFAGAYGSVAPNLPNLELDQPYRCAVDIPVQDRLARVYLPAGAIATGQNTTPNDFYGTVVGASNLGTLKVRLTYGATVLDNIPVTNFAFGTRINTPGYLGYNRCRVEVIQTISTTSTTIVDRFVNKGPGPLALDLRTVPSSSQIFVGGVPAGLSTLGFGIEPWSSSPPDMLAQPPNETLIARWNGSKARYDIYPDTGCFEQGAGYFVRMPSPLASFVVSGRTSPATPIGVALRPGWNMIANPTTQPVPTANVLVVSAANTPKTFADALGFELGTTFFEFQRGSNDPATGAPETGTMVAATEFLPGRMYFVRVLVAEGATLLFSPTGPGRPSSNIQPTPRAAIRLTLESLGKRTSAVIGQSYSASRNFDPREDAELPPGTHGMQASIAERRLFTDMRKTGDDGIYTLKLDGLVPNRSYRLSTAYIAGPSVRYWMRMQGSQAWNVYDDPVFRTIRPSGTSYTVELRMEGR